MGIQDTKLKSLSPLGASVAMLLGIVGFLQAESSSACGADGLLGAAVRAALGGLLSFLPGALQALTNCAVLHHGLAEAFLRVTASAEVLVKALGAIN